MGPAAIIRALAVIAALFAISGCSALSAIGDVSKALEVYELRPPADVVAARGRPLSTDVVVELPTTSGALATDRIMIRPNPLQAQYLPDVRWSEPTPVMVQTLMLRAIEASQAVRYVGRRPLGASGDYAIVTEIVDFQAEVADNDETARVRMRIIVRLVREDDASIAASRTFTADATAASLETPALVAAFDAASNRLLSEFAVWVPAELAAR
ncbi:MAG: ABC-type transport auxiliary lipoprotein family protein [Paracoccaceae bacterium]